MTFGLLNALSEFFRAHPTEQICLRSKEGKGMTDEIVEVDNPCYHCYTGAIGECYSVGCRYAHYPWSGELEEDYKVEVKKENEMAKQ